MIDELHFIRPGWLLLMLAVPLLWWLLRRPGAELRAWERVFDQHLLRHLQVGQATTGRRHLWWPLAVAWLLASVALAGPSWERQPQSMVASSQARVVVLDLSQSMMATDLAPNRLQQARFKLEDLLARSREGQTALIAFAADAHVVTPLTDDTRTISNLLRSLDPSVMPAQGSNLTRGLQLAGQLLRNGALAGGQVLVVADDANASAVDAAQQLRADGYRVSVLGVGTVAGAPIPQPRGNFLKDRQGQVVVPVLDQSALQSVATAGGGRYVTLTTDTSDLDRLLDEGLLEAIAGSAADEQSEQWLDSGPWLVLVLLPLAALAFRRGWLLALMLVVTLPTVPTAGAQTEAAESVSPPPTLADRVGDWLRNREQRAERAMQVEEYDRALALSENALRRGNALYRAGDFAAAGRQYALRDDVDGHYNRGNALAQQQQYEQAIAAYDEALALEPHHADATHNKQLLEQLLEDQQEQSQDDQQSEDSEQEEEQDQQPEDGDEEQSDDQQQQDADENAEQEPENQEQQAEPDEQETMDEEERQAVEQWLRRIPDDPGGLLRRKFRLQYQQRDVPPRENDEDW